MNMLAILLKPAAAPVTLADEAISAVGQFDALKAQGTKSLRKYRERLSIHVRRGLDALAAIDTVLQREGDIETAAKIAKAETDIEEALDGIELDLSEPANKPASSKRRSGKPLAAVEA